MSHRQITFGSNQINYFDTDDNPSNRLPVQQSARLRHESPILLHRESIPVERASSVRNVPTISLNSAFSTGANGGARDSEIVFFAGEDIYRDGVVGTRDLAVKKYSKIKFDLDVSRTFESYCYEFCGLLNVKFHDIRFLMDRKELLLSRVVKKACEVIVKYNKILYSRFANVGDYAL
jgi:hypothetical protein